MIRVGIGGWNFAPWRGVFYPKGLAQAQELTYASRQLTSIEINSTFYSLPKPDAVKRWASETPEGFVFSVKAPMMAVNRKILAEAGPSIERFLGSGILHLGAKLGPLFWQLAPTKKFQADDLEAFLALLPRTAGGLKLRHALEVRDKGFATPAFVELARKYAVAIITVDSEKHALIADVTSDFVYLRLQRTAAEVETGYAPKAIAAWTARANAWAEGGAPKDLPMIGPAAPKAKRDVFVYFISGAKERAPAAAMAMIKAVG
jgi:uncharacterized protein YecE (DUF72 family)